MEKEGNGKKQEMEGKKEERSITATDRLNVHLWKERSFLL